MKCVKWARKRERSLTSSVAFRTEVFKKTKERQRQRQTKTTTTKTHPWLSTPPARRGICTPRCTRASWRRRFFPCFLFFSIEFNYTSSGYYIGILFGTRKEPRKVTKSACVFIMMMSFFLLLNWKNWISFETQKDKKREGFSRIRENANAFYLPSHRSTRVEIKGTQHDGKEAERAGRFVFSDEYPHTHTHT